MIRSLLMVVFLLGSTSLWASQNARVVIDQATIRQEPDEDSETLVQIPKETVVRISNKSQESWFKILIPGTENEPKYGWIRSEEILPYRLKKELQDARVQPGPTRVDDLEEIVDRKGTWSLIPFFQYGSYGSLEPFQREMGAPIETIHKADLGLEISLRPNRSAGLGIYFVPLMKIEDPKYSISSVCLVAIVPEWYPMYTDRQRIAIGVGIGTAPMKIGAGTSRSETADLKLFLAPLLFLRVGYTLNLKKSFGVRFSGGYRSFLATGVPTSKLTGNPANGRVRMDLGGPFVDAGLVFDF